MTNKFNVFFVFLLFINTIGAQSVPNDWYFGNPDSEYMGISLYKTYDEIIKDRIGKPVIVAIIDSGIDFKHEDLADNMWINPGEIPNNGIDDDKNGYIDDVYGWNFIGGPDGKNVGQDSYEATRVYGSLKYKYENANPDKLNKKQKAEYDIFIKAKQNVEKEINSAKNNLVQISNIETKVSNSFEAFANKLGDQPLTEEFLENFDAGGSQELNMAKNLISQYLKNSDLKTIAEIQAQILDEISQDKTTYQNKLDYAFNPDFDPRKTIVKDDYSNPYEKYYGNNDVQGPDALHGTHVGGIVGSIRGNNLGTDGIANNVKLMSVRAVPDGDERDKDVANAIRYAVDNGATIINMSFGKGFGTHKTVVDEAVKYAEKRDVLLIHAAGNSAQSNDKIENFPNPNYEKKEGFIFKKKKRAKNWIEVGASSYKPGEDAIARFSNYGKNQVDVFAPGEQIYSTLPDNVYAPLQGTSMAAPVVAGVAAMIRSYYPSLTAEQVKEAIMKSVTPTSQLVKLPGSKTEKVKFSDLSASGGIINFYNAMDYASKMKGKKKLNKERA